MGPPSAFGLPSTAMSPAGFSAQLVETATGRNAPSASATMGVPMADADHAPILGGFWRDIAPTRLICPRCQREETYELLVGFDWRDITAQEAVRTQYPTVACTRCGGHIPNSRPVVQLRPGDPLRLLVALPESPAPTTDHLSPILNRFSVDGIVVGPLTALPVALSLQLFDRYTGPLVGTRTPMPHDVAPELAAWARQFVAETDPPDVAATLARVVSENDPDRAGAIVEENLEVLDDRWRPVRAEAYRRLRALVPDGEDRRTLESRLRRIDQIVLLGAVPPADQDDLPSEVRDAIDAAVATDAHDETGERRNLLLVALDRLRRHPHPLLLIGALNSTVAALTHAPTRTDADTDLAAELSDELVELAIAELGPTHRLVRRARNDRAVARMEQRNVDRTDVIAELADLAEQCINHEDPLAADVVLNLAVAFAEATTTPTADEQRHLIALFQQSRHLHRLHDPYDHATAARLLNNLGAALRRAPLGARPEHQRQAAEAYAEALGIDDAHHVLAPSGRFQVEVNLATAQIEVRISSLDAGGVGELTAVLDTMADRTTSRYGISHPTRIRMMSNLAALAIDCYDAAYRLGVGDIALLDRAIAWASDHADLPTTPEDLRLVLRNTVAVARARPGPNGQPYQADLAWDGFEAVLAQATLPDHAGQRRATRRATWASSSSARATGPGRPAPTRRGPRRRRR